MPDSEPPPDFRRLFCARFRCPDERFEEVALRRLIHRRWAWLPWVLGGGLRAKVFATDLALIRQLGRVTSRANLVAEVQDLRGDYARRNDFGFVRSSFKFRISGDRVLKTARGFWTSEPRPQISTQRLANGAA
jgi:hypothetical protein